MLKEDYSSDSNDEDYQPTEGVEVSEEEESGEEEVPLEGGADDDGGKRGKRKRKKGDSNKLFKKKSQADAPGLLVLGVSEERKEEEKKRKQEDLWNDFMKDVADGGKGKKIETSKKVTVLKEYKFAGEVIKISSEVDADSKEAKSEKILNEISSSSSSLLPPTSLSSPLFTSLSSASPSSSSSASLQAPSSAPQVSLIKGPPTVKRSGISSILDKMSKKPKLSVLNKSLLDWNDFKAREGIDADLKRHNKGKNGYLEKQAFLQRTDLKQFEIEKDIRTKRKTSSS